MAYFIEKILDIVIDYAFKLSIYLFKIISPIKISPKKINRNTDQEWQSIYNLKIENKLNEDLYGIQICGISKKTFDVKIISDNGTKGGTVEHMKLNTNYLSIHAIDKQTKNYLWIFRINKLKAKEVFNMSIKTNNTEDVYFKTQCYEKIETPIKERKDGAVEIPFQKNNIPKI